MDTIVLPLVAAGAESVVTVGASAAVGVYARRIGLLPESAQKVLDKLVSSVFLPCLILAKVIPHFSLAELTLVWPLTLMCIFLVVYGLLAGAVASSVCGFLTGQQAAFAQYRGLMMVAIAFPNSFSVPLTLMFALGNHPVLVAEGDPNGAGLHARVHMMFLLSYAVWVLARWGIGFPILSGVKSISEWWSKMLNPPVLACLLAASVGLAQGALPSPPPGWMLRPAKTAVEYAGGCTVPVILMSLGARLDEAVIEVAAWCRGRAALPDLSPGQTGQKVPDQKAPGQEAPGLEAAEASELAHLAAGEGADEPEDAEQGRVVDELAKTEPAVPEVLGMPVSAYMVVLFLRQFVGPFLGALAACGLLRNLLGVQDRPVLMVAMLQSAGPPMINLAVMAGISGSAERETAKLILLTYGVSVVTWTASIALFLLLLDA